MKRLSIFFCIVLCSTKVVACLNYYVINERGEVGHYDYDYPYEIYQNNNPEAYLKELKWYEKRIAEKNGMDKVWYTSNYSFYLVKLGRNKEALAILQKLATANPGEYQVLANLATAYELNGHLDSALKYIQRSIKLNPLSHFGSEWFHQRFLEAAIEVRDKKTPVNELDILKLSADTSAKAGNEIAEQLRERVPLTNAPNELLCKAIEEAADYFRKNISVDWAVKFYAIAVGFAANEAQSNRINLKIEAAINRIMFLNKTNPPQRPVDPVRKELMKDTRMGYIQKDIDLWKKNKALYVENMTPMIF
ncbi:tetratricopeptide repeat protein [Ferruginibacter sp.]